MKWSVVLLAMLLLPAVGAIELIIPSELNTTISANYQPDIIKPFKVYEGDWQPTLAKFQVQNNGPEKEAYIFAWTSDPNVVTISKVAEVLWHTTLRNGTNNFTLGLYGVNYGKAVVTYGVLYDIKEPQVYNGEPYSHLPLDTYKANLSVYTTETDAQCRYSEVPYTSYRNMKNPLNNDGHWHTKTLWNLQNNHSYTYYIKCWRPINWSYQGNQSSFIVNVTCIRDGWCSPGQPSKDNDISYMYLGVNEEDYVVNFSVGNYYPPPPPEPIPEPSKPIVIEMPEYVPSVREPEPVVVEVNDSKAATIQEAVKEPDPVPVVEEVQEVPAEVTGVPCNPKRPLELQPDCIPQSEESVTQVNESKDAFVDQSSDRIAPTNKSKAFFMYLVLGSIFMLLLCAVLVMVRDE